VIFCICNFGYNTSGLILHNITLTIKRGQMTALVRASGAGKSTLVDLIQDSTIQYKVEFSLMELICGSLRSNQCVKDGCREVKIRSFSILLFGAMAYGTEEADEAKFGRQL